MPGKGGKQSEETKKKISEALQKPGSDDSKKSRGIPKSPIAKKLFGEYQTSKNATIKLRAQRDSLKEQKRGLPRGRAGKAARANLNSQLKKVRETMRGEVKNRKEIRTKAKQAKRVARAKIKIAKAKQRTRKLNSRKNKVRARMQKLKSKKFKGSKSPQREKRRKERLKRMEAQLKRIEDMKARQKEVVSNSRNTIASKGVVTKSKTPAAFRFSEILENCTYLISKPFKLARPLTPVEEKTDFVLLNAQFNSIEEDIESEMSAITKTAIALFISRLSSKLKSGDVKGIADIKVGNKNNIKRVLGQNIDTAFVVGKKSAAKEIGVEIPPTPKSQTDLKNLDVDGLSEAFTTELNNTGKNTIKNALSVGATAVAIIAATREKMVSTASRMIMNMSGTTVGQYVNRGRKQVFFSNIPKISKFERSEVLDLRTCNMCLTLDGRVVKADDPMAQMDLVHTHCRGVWVPVLVEEEQPGINPIPKTAISGFDLIDGKPVINSFKQLKKPINKANAEAQKVIQDKLK